MRRAPARTATSQRRGAEEIHQALRRVLDNQHAIDPAVQHHLIDAITSNPGARSRATQLFTRIDARDRAQAVAYAYQHNLVSPPEA